MPACCVCYTTDPAYLLPTLVSAIQARRHAARGKADIVILSFGSQTSVETTFDRICRAEGIRFIPCTTGMIDDAPVMLARLFLARLVPPEYGQLLYLDGDTQITGSLDPLIDAEVPDGQFLAANDPMNFSVPGRGAHSHAIARHFHSLRLPTQGGYSYFNTGVLRINRSGWDEIGRSAWALFRENPCTRFPDQDVLNVAAGARRIPISLTWNFPIYLLNARMKTVIAPRIYHFMSNPKPWHGPFQPWGSSGRTPYVDITVKYPELLPYLDVMPAATRLRYHLQQRYKQLTETFIWGMGAKRSRILSYERELAATPGAHDCVVEVVPKYQQREPMARSA